MHAGFFDVFHDSAENHVRSIGQRIHIDFRSFLEELIDQHGPRRPHQRRLRDVILHRVHVVRDHHGAPAKHVAGPHEHGQANFSRHASRFLRH